MSARGRPLHHALPTLWRTTIAVALLLLLVDLPQSACFVPKPAFPLMAPTQRRKISTKSEPSIAHETTTSATPATKTKSSGPPLAAGAALVNTKAVRVLWATLTAPLKFVATQFASLTSKQKLLLVGTFVLGFWAGRQRPFWKRFTDMNDIPASLFGPDAPALVGRVASVSDGDTIRFLHQPTRFHPAVLEKGQKLSEFALPIRVCTIDTPETAKFGKKGQPFGEEAKQALKDFLGDQPVYVRLLHKDQYSRGVAQIFVRDMLRQPTYVDEHLLGQGLAEVYRGGGAVYGPKGLEAYSAMEEEAQANKLGIWSLDNRESAAEYKRRTKE